MKITLQLSSDVKEALLQTEEELRQMASQNKEIVEQHKQFHNSLTLVRRLLHVYSHYRLKTLV